MTLRSVLAGCSFGFVLAACATVGSRHVPFELGAAEFHGGDRVTIEDVQSTTGSFSPGSVVTVRGRYSLASRHTCTLYLGTTVTEGDRSDSSDARQSCRVAHGSGAFELQHHIPAEGWLHVTLYDVGTGQPFAGQYFGSDRTLLVAKDWSYSR
jgi:hypothetical protein